MSKLADWINTNYTSLILTVNNTIFSICKQWLYYLAEELLTLIIMFNKYFFFCTLVHLVSYFSNIGIILVANVFRFY